MTDVLVFALVLLGSGFMVIAALGVVRFPDLPMRMHAGTKAGTLGAGLVLAAVAVAYGEAGVTVRALATIAFLFLTAPVAAHVIGRAAVASGTLRLWKNTCLNEMADMEAASGNGPAAISETAAAAAPDEPPASPPPVA